MNKRKMEFEVFQGMIKSSDGNGFITEDFNEFREYLVKNKEFILEVHLEPTDGLLKGRALLIEEILKSVSIPCFWAFNPRCYNV